MANEEKKKDEGAQITFKEVKIIQPWDKFAEQGDIKTLDTIKIADVAAVAKAYHKFVEEQSPILGSCISCGRRFKKQSKKDIDEGTSALIGIGRGQ
jgi:hypothetical protein